MPEPPPHGGDAAFTEAGAWPVTSGSWQHLHGHFGNLGYSIEWHDFTIARELNWARSFHPGGVEICLNLAGHGWVKAGDDRLNFAPLQAGFYLQTERQLAGARAGGERHQFITVELSSAFMARHFGGQEPGIDPKLGAFLKGRSALGVSSSVRLKSEHQQLIGSLRHPPVCAAAQRVWYHAKALEVAAALFYRPAGDELFCQRQKRQNQERVQKVIAVLKEDLGETLSLEDIGRRVGCSHFHLSRIFSQESGKSIFQYLRELRLERAAELLREGKLTVTQIALEVGYSSPSHFSTAFHEMFGCCPGLYPMATLSQRTARGWQRRS